MLLSIFEIVAYFVEIRCINMINSDINSNNKQGNSLNLNLLAK